MQTEDPEDVTLTLTIKGKKLEQALYALFLRRGFTPTSGINFSNNDDTVQTPITALKLGPVELRSATQMERLCWIEEVLEDDLKQAITLMGKDVAAQKLLAFAGQLKLNLGTPIPTGPVLRAFTTSPEILEEDPDLPVRDEKLDNDIEASLVASRGIPPPRKGR